MKWKYIILILLFYAVVVVAYFLMTLRHVILFWIIFFSALFLFSQLGRLYLLFRAKRSNEAEAVRLLRIGILTDLVLDVPLILILLGLYFCDLNDWLTLFVGGSLAMATSILREYLKRRFLATKS